MAAHAAVMSCFTALGKEPVNNWSKDRWQNKNEGGWMAEATHGKEVHDPVWMETHSLKMNDLELILQTSIGQGYVFCSFTILLK